MLCVTTLLTTCEPNTFYNKTPDQYLTKISEANEDTVRADLAIIEFDEFGTMWDRKQLDDTLSLIKRRNVESDSGILLLTFTHGWKSNADPEAKTGDLVKFRKTVKDLAKVLRESKRPAPDHVVGVYLGWRGISSKLPVLNTMTFWGRNRVANRIASHEMREALISMAKMAKEYPSSKVHMTGHSMGGMILSRTIAPSLTTALMLSGSEGHKFLADLLVLKNPALDGLTTSQFIDFLKTNNVVAELRSPDGSVEPARGPAIVSITSEADWVTAGAYPAGKIVGNLITATDFRKDSKLGMPSQKILATHTLGHTDHLISHKAWIEGGYLVLERVPDSYNNTPFWVVQVSEEISSSHNDINNPRFNELVKRLIEMNRLYDTKAQTWLRMVDDE